MKTTHTLFCDETGNTGSRFLDPAQPVFAEGGWVISHKNQAAATRAVKKIEQELGFKSPELKGKDLIKTTRGQRLIFDVIQAVGKNGGIPYIHVVEKRYFVCTKIVETFFDTEFNPRVPPAEGYDPDQRKKDAQIFYDLGDSLIDDFAEAYRLKDATRVKENAKAWTLRASLMGLTDFADKIEGVLPEIEDEIRAEKRAGESNEIPPGLDSLNLPIVFQLFQFIEEHCPYKCEVVHDRTHSFEPIYEYSYNLFAKAQPGVIGLKDGTRIHFGFKKACSLSFADSKTEPMLRAADFALAGARHFIYLVMRDKPIPTDVTPIAFATLGAILCETFRYTYPQLGSFPHLGDIIASRQWAKMVFERLTTELREVL